MRFVGYSGQGKCHQR